MRISQSPRWRRICSISSSFSMKLIILIEPWHFGHTSGSTSKFSGLNAPNSGGTLWKTSRWGWYHPYLLFSHPPGFVQMMAVVPYSLLIPAGNVRHQPGQAVQGSKNFSVFREIGRTGKITFVCKKMPNHGQSPKNGP